MIPSHRLEEISMVEIKNIVAARQARPPYLLGKIKLEFSLGLNQKSQLKSDWPTLALLGAFLAFHCFLLWLLGLRGDQSVPLSSIEPNFVCLGRPRETSVTLSTFLCQNNLFIRGSSVAFYMSFSSNNSHYYLI